MGRSVSYANNSVQVEYATFECEDSEWAGDEFQDCISYLQDVASKHYPSLTPCDEWVDREDQAVLENRHCYIGVSEYCGLVSVWVQPKGEDRYSDPSGLALHWCGQINLRPLAACFGTALISRGRFSNGEQIFSAANPAQTQGDLGLGFTSKEGWL
jgi:hypothetical protein